MKLVSALFELFFAFVNLGLALLIVVLGLIQFLIVAAVSCGVLAVGLFFFLLIF